MRLFAARLTTCLILTLSILSPAAALAQGFSALARVLPEQSSLVDKGSDVELQLGLSQGVPYRIFALRDPYRLVLDFQEVDWTGLQLETFDRSETIESARFGGYVPAGRGWC